ncbi:MAG: response regulator transcription factor [Oscillospiraceae bacterium]|nr:response regulator transcription factor [Oscillospiraceae bacterium]
MNRKQILLVDDDASLSAIIMQMLEGCGYAVTRAGTAEAAYDLLASRRFHLILLDINLPDADGFEVCRALRRASSVPVIFASARTAEDDRIRGLEIGGDDYLPKPYSLKELLARIHALMRRTYGFSEMQDEIRFGDVTVKQAARSVTKNGSPVSLAQREFDLLLYLCQHRNTAIAKEKLLSEVWGAFSDAEPSTVAVHIRWLREKLEDDPANPKYIKTIWRLGYMLEAEE